MALFAHNRVCEPSSLYYSISLFSTRRFFRVLKLKRKVLVIFPAPFEATETSLFGKVSCSHLYRELSQSSIASIFLSFPSSPFDITYLIYLWRWKGFRFLFDVGFARLLAYIEIGAHAGFDHGFEIVVRASFLFSALR